MAYQRCEYCGDEFYVRPYKLRTFKNHFCTIDCKFMYWNENLTDKQEEILTIIKNIGNPVAIGFLGEYGYPRSTLRHTLSKLIDLGRVDWKWIDGKTKGYFAK